MKILSPAGNFESLKMAVFNGADEIYLGISHFNARNNIDGFSIDSLEQAVNFAHLYNVKVHLAINILFSDDEMQDALDIVGKSLEIGVDAFIVQDLGLIAKINELYPNAQIHLSTQMAIHNLEGILALKKYKFSRVVLARETPLSEIKRIKKATDIEIEYFVQGALCVSFSGNCYLSSYLLGASGNRGKCKQLCRLPFSFYKQNKKLKSGYLLSAKDFNMLDRLDDLKNAGVDAIKIEGRARRPYYVAVATRQYYNALNGLKTDKEEMQLAFNRTYTEGYFNGNGNIISNHQSHIGICVGKVDNFIKGKKFNQVYLSSNRKLTKKSTLKFILRDKESTVSAFDLKEIAQNKYLLTTTNMIEKGASVHLIVDSEKEKQVLSVIKKQPIDIQIFANIDKPILAKFNINGKEQVVYGDILSQAKSSPLKQEEIISNFNKSEIFEPRLDIIALDSVFILKQRLNQFRREVFAKIEQLLIGEKKDIQLKKVGKVPIVNGLSDFVIVDDLGKEFSAKHVIFSPSEYDQKQIMEFKNKCEKQDKIPYLDTPNFALEEDIAFLKRIIEKTNIGIVANNYYALSLSDNLIIGAGLNVFNSYTAFEHNKPFICAESDKFNRVDFFYMTLRHCPMKNLLNANCDACPYQNDFFYKMDSGKQLKLRRKKLKTCTFYLTD